MADLRWPVIITTAVLALALFFGFNYYRQRYLQEEPFLESLVQMAEIDQASILREQGTEVLVFTPSGSFRGPLHNLVVEIQSQAEEHYRRPLQVAVNDKRNERLESFALAVSPALYEGARLGSYRSAAESITAQAGAYELQEVLFTVDEERFYLQARDQEHYLYLIIQLREPERGA